MTLPTPPHYNQVNCALNTSGQGFELTITGTTGGSLAGYKYSVNNRGVRKTLQHPKGVPSADCWSVKGAVCDAS